MKDSSLNIYWILFASLLLICCSKNQSSKASEEDVPPHTTICLQPFDNYTQQEAKQVKEVLEKMFLEFFDADFEFEVLPNREFTTDLMNDDKTRYRADKIIKLMSNEATSHRIMIGLTHKDVSCTYKGIQDWGVLGLSIHGTHACVASDFRLKSKRRDYWKVVTHEFTHTFFRYGHCPEDNPICIMKDAKGHPDFSKKESFCKTCKERINKKNKH
jgi:archaemetzincin